MDFQHLPLQVAPGLVTNVAPYDAKGRYIAGSNVRFYQGAPEKIGGWVLGVGSDRSLGGPARGVHAWAGLDGTRCVAWGTATKLWLMKRGTNLYDITPVGMPPGLIDGADSFAFGEPSWGQGPWGGAVKYFTSPIQPRVWTISNWGEDLVACYRGGPLYVWQASIGTGSPAAVVPSAPSTMLSFFVSETNRYLVAIGAGDPMTIAWCNQQDLTNWTASSSSTAGDKRLEIGSVIVASADTRFGRLVLTDAAAYLVAYIGPPYIFSVTKVGEGHDPPIGPNAIISKNGVAYWMGPEHIFTFNGMVQALASPVENEVYDNLNKTQSYKIFGGTNRRFNEITFFYPDVRNGRENARYVSFNDDGWSLGQVPRTSWIDESVSANFPMATSPDGTIYLHEVGVDAAGSPLPYSFETGEIELGVGDEFMHIRKLIPAYQRLKGAHAIDIETRRYPQEAGHVETYAITPEKPRVSVRARGRSVRLRMHGNTLGCDFRLGQFRAAVRPDGGRG